MKLFNREPDRIWKNNYTDQEVFYGFDDGEGRTDWYDKNGNLDSYSYTPTDEEQEQNNEGY